MALAVIVRAADIGSYTVTVSNSAALWHSHRSFFEPRKCFAAFLFSCPIKSFDLGVRLCFASPWLG
jgi:hypothetical protein